MERKKTFTMNWNALEENDDDDDHFFETNDRLSSAIPDDLASSGSDDDEFEDPRMSFASSFSSRSFNAASVATAEAMTPEYDIWMSAPGSINERRKRLLQGMGLSSEKELVRIATSRQIPLTVNGDGKVDGNGDGDATVKVTGDEVVNGEDVVQEVMMNSVPVVLVRSRSDSDIGSFTIERKRKDVLLGDVSKQRLTRTSSVMIVSQGRLCPYQDQGNVGSKDGGNVHTFDRNGLAPLLSNSGFGAFFLIKNLDTGKEFVVNEYNQDGMWNRVSDLQTGKQLTLEEFENCVGHSKVVKELMRRENLNSDGDDHGGDDRKLSANSYISKSLRISKRRGAAILKNIKGVAHSMSMPGFKNAENTHTKERDHSPTSESNSGNSNSNSNSKNPSPPSGWVKVRHAAKSHKELSALHMCQEIQAHQGAIWSIKFSPDARFLASGGEDRSIHIWEVQECEIMSLNEGTTPFHPFSTASPSLGDVSPMPSEKRKSKKKGSSAKKTNPIPEFVHASETMFSLSDKPLCSFFGHLDDVLDLSWSRSQLLLSSSMDKTVRLWDMETKSCLKLFAHNDYVTCIQFNPMDDNYFISGSLDNKVRIWSIPDRQLVDWTDLHEMVTAVCYTPDGQGALIGSHKGNCRMYNVEDCKINQVEQVDLQNKKNAKKITGFQFSPGNPSEVLVTSADSRIRILDGQDLVHKFRGFRNINSQISASFSSDGKYVICASEDSHVYIWKRDERGGHAKTKTIMNTRSHENFQCRDVSMAILWPGTVKGEPPTVQQLTSKRHSKRSSFSQQNSTCGSPSKEDASHRCMSPSRHDASMREEITNSPRMNSKGHDHDSPVAEDNAKRQLPPLPKKNNKNDNNNNNSSIERTSSEEDMISRSDSGLGDSFNTAGSSSIRYGDSPSITSHAATPSSSWSTSWSWFDGSSHGSHTVQATAWGMVIVTATLGGEIRAYQNFGLPRRIGRQSNLF
ncbi:Transducin/WD40 repeat-like superfamily protein [Euphorbia peplus]|nr:Transducin/WD40 repeat-like superfamily protein [Euphorbia peplus]